MQPLSGSQSLPTTCCMDHQLKVMDEGSVTDSEKKRGQAWGRLRRISVEKLAHTDKGAWKHRAAFSRT
eukprot:352088-Chlamydomonas_euryale.AAC.2